MKDNFKLKELKFKLEKLESKKYKVLKEIEIEVSKKNYKEYHKYIGKAFFYNQEYYCIVKGVSDNGDIIFDAIMYGDYNNQIEISFDKEQTGSYFIKNSKKIGVDRYKKIVSKIIDKLNI